MASVRLEAEQTIRLDGELKFPVIVAVRKQVEQMLSGLDGDVNLDFAGVTAADSSALSFWLCCLRFANGNGTRLHALNLSEELRGIVRLVGLEKQIA
ncbi:STAS domain-containing protein [Neptuniibacter halophilus]|uniref:STAS domain-containing protein n=1 Tax=Neptuniibacter halophilus TaxID=651666 RepID=UPI0025748E0A|nr:STAS domain-containing protein [Neptuniibacter halophilus]